MNRIAILFSFAVLISCQQENIDQKISQDTIARHMAALASDEFQGRMPCSEGEEKTIAYLVEEMKALGLQPGN
ncbi:hypothetical protein [Portibacter marinus]|uniref:hypothetical protein n=1 Tax=Portibacter marinus TaxID=2898660 RepID=UPI001F48488F|nr:hypothetical protein [Portibacter marinus]